MEIRAALDSDSAGLIALISGCFAEYAGCIFDLDELPELRAIASTFAKKRGEFWVAVEESTIVGCVGLAPTTPTHVELHKLYVRADARRLGLGSTLCERVENTAREHGARTIELWSDTKFLTAHRFYERRGYVKQPQTRALHDRSNTVEYYFKKPIL